VVENRWERNGLTEWSCGELPEVVEFTRQGLTLRGYPALVDAGDAVDLKLFDDPDEALASHRLGLRRLAMRVLAKEVKYLHKNLPGIDRMCLHYAPVGKCEALRGELVAAAVDRALVVEPLPRDAAAFAARIEEGRKRLVEEGNALSRDVGAALAEYHAVAKRLKGALPPTWLEAVRDIREQLDRLVYPGFVAATPPEVLPQLARYLKAIGVRLEKLSGRLQKDRQAALEVKALWQAWAERTADGKRGGPEWTEFRWLLEELRVSLFAQELKTRVPVSAARLGKRLAELGKA